MELNSKIAVITGGKRGIGKAISELFAREGMNLAICAKNQEGLAELEKELRSVNANIEILTRQVDVRKPSEVKNFVKDVKAKFNKIDILVNNAAVIRPGLLHYASEENWDLVMDTNLKGPFLMMKEVIPEMKKVKSGQIVNICSVLGKQGFPNFSLHCAAKFGLRGLSLSVKEELRQDNIQVIIINPGTVTTEMWNDIEGEYDHSKMVTPEDVASCVLFAVKNSNNCTLDELDVTPKLDIELNR